MRGEKKTNEYAAAFEQLYARTPKAVFAAVAYSYALRIAEDRPDKAVPEFLREWETLYRNGIVPQMPRA